MPKADFSKWTPPEHIANMLFLWASDPEMRPSNGSFHVPHTSNGETTWEQVE